MNLVDTVIERLIMGAPAPVAPPKPGTRPAPATPSTPGRPRPGTRPWRPTPRPGITPRPKAEDEEEAERVAERYVAVPPPPLE